MMNMKKMLALLLAVVMVVGMIPFGAMAEEAEPVTHIETCLEGCVLEDCACTCHAAPETPAEEPKQEQPPVGPASLDDTQTQETPVCTCTPVEGVHAAECALYVAPEVPEEQKEEEPEEKQCTCTPVEGVHSAECALYVAPEAPVEQPEEKQCTCTPVEGVHAVECALYVAPEAPVEPEMTEEEVEALYNAIMACNSMDELNAVSANITESKAEAFFATLSDEKIEDLTDCLLSIFKMEYPAKETVLKESVIVHPTVSNTNVAPFKEPVEIAPVMRLFSFKAAAVAEETTDNGLELDKTVSDPDADGVYTLTLEAYATGDKTITEETTSVPTDIILVLDQSGSMDYDFTVSTYDPFSADTAEEYYQQAMNSLYVKLDDGSYASVIVEKSVNVTNPASAAGKSNSDYANLNGLYHKCDEDTYGVLTVEENSYLWGALKFYLYTCENCGEVSYGVYTIITGSSAPGNNGEFYTADSSSVTYTFSYVDQSGTTQTYGPGTDVPDWDFHTAGSSGTSTRLAALKTAVTTFTNNVKAKAEADEIDHRVAIVGFASPSGNGNNSEVLTLDGDNSSYDSGKIGVSYSELTSDADNYAGALQDMSTSDGQTMVANAIAALDAEGATRVDLGMEMANQIFANDNPPAGERNRVIVVFTDGVPTTSNSYSETVATSAINYGSTAKSTYGATVYTVGIFDGADSTKDGSNSGNASETQKANWFMHRLSSNTKYPQSPSYYLTASNSTELNNIFQKISQNIETGGSSIILNKEAVVKDVITDQFVLPNGADTSQIKVYTAACTGVDASGNLTFGDKTLFTGASVDIDEQTVTVTNYDFAENWCGTETVNGKPSYRGNKLVIEIPVKLREGFLGGNNVLTNGEGSGVYENINAETPIEEFVSPNVDIQIKDVTVTAPDYNVYLLGGITADQLKAGLSVTVGNVALDLDADNFGLQTWQNAYVTIDDGESMASLSNMTVDADYSVTVTVTPTEQGTVTAKTNSDSGNIYVWVPSLTYKDTVHDYMSVEPTYDTNNKVDAMTWVHGTDTYDASKMFNQTAPAVTLSYVPVSGITDGKITSKDHVPVNVIAKIGTADITSHVVFNHQNCDFEGCPYDGNGNVEFYLHVINVSADLKIKKTITGTIDTDQPFVFVIQGASDNDLTKNIRLTVSIQGAGEVTIKDLPIGTYTVTEDTSWAWRFTPSYTNNPITLVADADNVVTISNTQKDDSWINDFSAVVKNTYGIANN